MSDWLAVVLGGVVGLALWYVRGVFLEVRSIRRMMNADRRISNEVQSHDD